MVRLFFYGFAYAEGFERLSDEMKNSMIDIMRKHLGKAD